MCYERHSRCLAPAGGSMKRIFDAKTMNYFVRTVRSTKIMPEWRIHMHTIKYRGCVAQQDNKTLEIFVNRPGCFERRYDGGKRMSGKELRTVIMQYLSDIGWQKPDRSDFLRSVKGVLI